MGHLILYIVKWYATTEVMLMSIQLDLTHMTFSNAFVCHWKQAKSEPSKRWWRKALQNWTQRAWKPYLFHSQLLVRVRKRTKSEKSFYIFFQKMKGTMSTKVTLIQGSNPGLGSQWNEVITKKILWTHVTNQIAKTLWPCHPQNNCFDEHNHLFWYLETWAIINYFFIPR